MEHKNKVIIGIDLGGTGIKIGIVDQEYEILAQTSIPTNAERPWQQIIADMGNTAAKLLKDSGYEFSDCLGAGAGCPGTIDSADGTVLYSNNIRWDHVPFAAELKKYLPLPVYINNDANCAALGEVAKGAAKGLKNAVFLTLGTGVGGGIVIDGRIFEGGHPGGAELGHIKAADEGRLCTCGRTDCLEAYASATALIKDAKEMARKNPDSMLWQLCGHDLCNMNAKIPFDAAQAGDACGKKLTENYIRYLADGITDLANIFRPDIIVLGGGVCAQGENLTGPLNAYLKANCFGTDSAYIPKAVTAQNGNAAGIIGAASLVGMQNAQSSAEDCREMQNVQSSAEPGQEMQNAQSSAESGLGMQNVQNAAESAAGIQNADSGAVQKEILFLEPVCTQNIWGGSRLKDEFHYLGAGEHTGECWGISAHPNGDGAIKNGRFAGCRLSVVWEKHPEYFGNYASDRLPLMVKIIDAKEDLSIQVHPDDAYAKIHENGSFGKTECWYVLDCKKDASLVIGHHAKTKEELVSMIETGAWKEFIREVPIKKGDFIQIDPGTVHAIKGGSLILETQQNSDVTYRLYDYDRLSNGKPRELHLQKSIDVINVPAKDAAQSVVSAKGLAKNQLNELYRCAYYRIFKLDVDGEMQLHEMEQEKGWPFLLMSVLEGSGWIDSYPLTKGSHLIVPYGYGSLCLKGKMSLMASVPGDAGQF